MMAMKIENNPNSIETANNHSGLKTKAKIPKIIEITPAVANNLRTKYEMIGL